tara:strand:- start:17993 stop:18166 length:174 start_codon:yes stop_codon:yes gene_type:complete
MTTLFYRGHDYVQHKEPASPENCVELTYRQNHYNTCRNQLENQLGVKLSYRGVVYGK